MSATSQQTRSEVDALRQEDRRQTQDLAATASSDAIVRRPRGNVGHSQFRRETTSPWSGAYDAERQETKTGFGQALEEQPTKFSPHVRSRTLRPAATRWSTPCTISRKRVHSRIENWAPTGCRRSRRPRWAIRDRRANLLKAVVKGVSQDEVDALLANSTRPHRRRPRRPCHRQAEPAAAPPPPATTAGRRASIGYVGSRCSHGQAAAGARQPATNGTAFNQNEVDALFGLDACRRASAALRSPRRTPPDLDERRP